MRLVCGVAIAFCLEIQMWGGVCQQPADTGSSNGASQAPAANGPQNESPTEEKKTTPAMPQPYETKPGASTSPEQNGAESQPGTQAQPAPTKSEPTEKPTAPSAAVKRHSTKKRTATPAADGKPRKVVIREGSTKEPTAQIVTGMAPEEASRQRQEAERLLGVTDTTVKRAAPGPVDAQRQETVEQIHHYMAVARAALKEDDISRAHTLAEKASLLAADLERYPGGLN
jgi:hypothetical protein